MNKTLATIAKRLQMCADRGETLLVFPHVRVDGDCLGSALAVVIAARKLGINAYVVMDEPIPDRLLYLKVNPAYYLLIDAVVVESYQKDPFVALAVDCSTADRMGQAGELYACASTKMVIDHHISSGKSTKMKYVDATASSTAEIVLDLIVLLEKQKKMSLLCADSANFLMVGIQSDTGRFSYQNTTPKTFRAAATLMEHGANVYNNAYYLFDVTDMASIRLSSMALSKAGFHYKNRLAITSVTQEMMRVCGASDDAADTLVATLRDIRGVEVSFVIRETPDGELRVNIRSNDPFDSATFASLFSGGGHHRAAGFTQTDTTIEALQATIVKKAGEFLSAKK